MNQLNLSIDSNLITDDFEKIAFELLNKWVLRVDSSIFRITEIEFYLNGSNHIDGYTHGHERQKKIGQWYFHASGIDLTFGSEDFFGGILIRGIYNLGTKKYVNGPIKVLTELFGSLDSIYLKKFEFGLMPDADSLIEIEKPIKAPRVGLNPLKDSNAFKKYYRFLVMPKEDHKDKTIIYNSLIDQGFSPEEAKIIWK